MLATIFLLVTFDGCGNSDKHQGLPSETAGATKETPDLCSSIMVSGLAKQCAVNSRDSRVEVTIDSFDDEVARNVCAGIADETTPMTAHLSGQWKLQVFSPYRSDKPLATCILR